MPRVGGKEYPYTKAGMAAAKKAAGKKRATSSSSSAREVQQKRNRGAAVSAQDKKTVANRKYWDNLMAAEKRLNLDNSFSGARESVKSNRIRSKSVTFEPIYADGQMGAQMFTNRTSDALQRSKRTKQSSTGAMKSRMAARKKGAR